MKEKVKTTTTKKNKPGAGRPCKLSEEIQKKIIGALKMGSYIETACKYAGITKQTFYTWLEKGTDEQHEYDNPAYKHFADTVHQAIAEAEIILLSDVRKKEQGWQASMTVMERRWPERWGQRSKSEVVSNVNVHKAAVDLSDEELIAVIEGSSSSRTVKTEIGT